MHTVLTTKGQRKGGSSKPRDRHDFESIGDIMRGLRWGSEALMTPTFDRPLSQKLDFFLVLEQHDAEADDDCA